MAETPATRHATFTNNGVGPRSLILASGETLIVRPGESTGDREFRAADLDGITTDFAEGSEGERTSPMALDTPLDGLDKTQLLRLAFELGYSTMGDDSSEDDIRTAIDRARSAAADRQAPLGGAGDDTGAVAELMNGNTRASLVELANAEGVQIETDDNKSQLATKIAAARASA